MFFETSDVWKIVGASGRSPLRDDNMKNFLGLFKEGIILSNSQNKINRKIEFRFA